MVIFQGQQLKKASIVLALLGAFFSATLFAANPIVIMETNLGPIEIELNPEQAPITVENFVDYTNKGFYDGTIFHRVIPGFMAQGGGFEADMSQKPTSAPIKNESNNGLKNKRGTIAMARTSAPNSATSQFFINLVDNDFLNGASSKPGYTVFGEVINGMEIVDKMAKIPTGRSGYHGDVPNETITIKSVTLKPAPKSESSSSSKNNS